MRLSPLMSMSDVRRAAILRRWLAMRNAPMPSRDALERIWQEVALARDDASPCLRFGDHEIRRYQSQLWWIKSVADNTKRRSPGPSGKHRWRCLPA
ncbi:tRNA(Ile)-lysidine ligase [Salmonella enterica subsp. enterica]|nr:tRNA(Ile)-lysidine ligase [Salmonella enterica subsp. enterica]